MFQALQVSNLNINPLIIIQSDVYIVSNWPKNEFPICSSTALICLEPHVKLTDQLCGLIFGLQQCKDPVRTCSSKIFSFLAWCLIGINYQQIVVLNYICRCNTIAFQHCFRLQSALYSKSNFPQLIVTFVIFSYTFKSVHTSFHNLQIYS